MGKLLEFGGGGDRSATTANNRVGDEIDTQARQNQHPVVGGSNLSAGANGDRIHSRSLASDNLKSIVRDRYQSAISQTADSLSRSVLAGIDLQTLHQAARLTSRTIAPLGTLTRRWEKRSLWSPAVCVIAGVTFSVLAINSPKTSSRFGFSALAIASVVVAKEQSKSGYELQTLNDLIVDNRKSTVSFGLTNESDDMSSPLSSESVSLHSLTDFCHVAIVGKTGSGKSYLTQHYVRVLGGKVKVLDSDAAPNEWQGLSVFGGGGNYEEIARQLAVDLTELERRTKLRANGQTSFDSYTTILEEAPETLNALKEADYTVGTKWLKALLRRGRKYGMRVILLSQGFNVATLGIQGEGDLRDNLDVIRLGKVAKDYAKTQKDKRIEDYLEQCDRPAMVNDIPTNVPNL